MNLYKLHHGYIFFYRARRLTDRFRHSWKVLGPGIFRMEVISGRKFSLPRQYHAFEGSKVPPSDIKHSLTVLCKSTG